LVHSLKGAAKEMYNSMSEQELEEFASVGSTKKGRRDDDRWLILWAENHKRIKYQINQ